MWANDAMSQGGRLLILGSRAKEDVNTFGVKVKLEKLIAAGGEFPFKKLNFKWMCELDRAVVTTPSIVLF